MCCANQLEFIYGQLVNLFRWYNIFLVFEIVLYDNMKSTMSLDIYTCSICNIVFCSHYSD